MPYLMQELLETMIVDAKHVVAFTGAGISTESGIPDFRSPGSGIWEKFNPSLMDLDDFMVNPLPFYEMAGEIAGPIFSAEPNPAHLALARLEAMGKLDGIITQNIDGLHQRAGSKVVVELHGSLRTCTCTRCGSQYPMKVLAKKLVNEGEMPPTCDGCQLGVLKPDAVFFGEQLPGAAIDAATRMAGRSDLLLILGSSVQVYPASSLPRVALDNGAQLAIINKEPTRLDQRAIIVLRSSLGDVLPDIVDRVAYRLEQMKGK